MPCTFALAPILITLAVALSATAATPATVHVLPEPPIDKATTGKKPNDALCPGPALQPVRVKVGGGAMVDTAFANLSQVMWVGPECKGVFTGSPTHVEYRGAWIAATDYFGASTYNDTKPIFRCV